MQNNVTDGKKRNDFILYEMNRVFKKFEFCENEHWTNTGESLTKTARYCNFLQASIIH
jgi:hypothetical protein